MPPFEDTPLLRPRPKADSLQAIASQGHKGFIFSWAQRSARPADFLAIWTKRRVGQISTLSEQRLGFQQTLRPLNALLNTTYTHGEKDICNPNVWEALPKSSGVGSLLTSSGSHNFFDTTTRVRGFGEPPLSI